MPKIVCTKCEVEFVCALSGAVTIETASFGAYKVWSSDIWTCPKCGVEVVAGFGQRPLREDHYASDFEEWLESVKKSAPRVVMDNEL